MENGAYIQSAISESIIKIDFQSAPNTNNNVINMKYWENGTAHFNFYSGVLLRSSSMLENNLKAYESHLLLLADLGSWIESQDVWVKIWGECED